MSKAWQSQTVRKASRLMLGFMLLTATHVFAAERSIPVPGRLRQILESRLEAPQAPRQGASQASKAESDWLVLPVLLQPGERLLEVQGDVPLRVFGTSAYHGHVIASVGVSRHDAPRLASSLAIHLRTGHSDTEVAHLQRADAVRWKRIHDTLSRWVVNPSALDTYAAPQGGAKGLASTNFAPTEQPSLEGSAVEMLIVTRDSLLAALQTYADERTAVGIPTVVRSIEWIEMHYPHGADLQETLRLFLRQAYELWGIDAVLLAGDTDLLPARYAHSTYVSPPAEVPTDLYFACLDGTWNADGDAYWGEAFDPYGEVGDEADLYPELYVGRLPFRDSQDVQEYRAKLLHYLTPTVAQEQDKLLFLAEVLWPANYTPGSPIIKNGADNAERLIALNDLDTGNAAAGIGPFRLSKMYEVPTGYADAGPLTRTTAIDSMNSGYSLVTHIGHGFRYTMSLGDASMTNLQAAGLSNGTQPFFLVMLNCTASAFDFPCLAEEFILNAHGGAVAVLGAAREAFPDGSQLYLEAWFKSIFDNNRVTAGQALNEARLEMASSTATEGVMRWTNFITAYLGDPTLCIWRSAPATPQVSFDSTPPLGEQVLTVQVSSPQGPVVGSSVTLWKPGDFYSVAHTDLSGTASLAFRAEAPGVADLHVGGSSITAYTTTVSFATPATPALRATGTVVVDDSGFGTQGNGNGILEAGEQATLSLAVKNEGGSTATNVNVSVGVTDPFLSVLDAFVMIPSLSPGQTANAPPVLVQLSQNVPDLHHVELDVLLSITGKSWHDRVPMDLLQVGPHVVGLQIDAANGSAPEPGETYSLQVSLRNDGFAELDGLTMSLGSNDPDVTIVSGPVALGSLSYRATTTASFQVSESSVVQRNWIDVTLQDAASRSWVFPIETRQPTPPDSLEVDPSIGPDQVALIWHASSSLDVAGYDVLRALDAAGPWTRANTDLVTSGTYFGDHGLVGNTTYHYAVVAVDSSGNPSLQSPVVQVTTNPAQRAGWPRVMQQWSSSSIVAANVEGDERPEIFAGADRLYAWRYDGVELLDGDGDPDTDGVFSVLGQNYTAGLAAADLDGDGFDEIVACSWDTHQVYVFDADGTVLPGWPRAMVGTTLGIWATPAVADLDLDGDLEVIVLALDGRLYVWHADGSEFLDGDADPATQGVFFLIPAPSNWSRGGPAVANLLTDDDTPEIVFGATNNRIYVLRADGSIPAGWPRVVGDEVSASPAIGDIDGDGVLDLVVPSQDGFLYALRADGSDLPGWPRAFDSQWGGALMPSVALHDFDGDGKMEIVAAGSNGGTENGQLAIFDAQGEFLPGWPVDVHSASQSSPILGDIDGDGEVEILFGGESGMVLGFELDGSTAPGFPIRLGAELRSTPTILDIDLDGDVDLTLAGWDQRVDVFDFSGVYRPGLVPWGTFKANRQRTSAYFPGVATDVAESTVPRTTRLLPNVPNPFNPMTRIVFDLAGTEPRPVQLVVHDVQGRRVRTLLDEALAPGRHTCIWDGRDDRGREMGSGVYFSRLVAGAVVSSRKMVLLR